MYRLTSQWLADSPLMPELTAQVVADHIEKDLVGAYNLGYLAWVQVFRVVTKRHAVYWMKLNMDTESERIVLLHLDDDGRMDEIHSFNIDLCPVTFTGDIIALSDDLSKTLIYNWRTDEQAYLNEGGNMQYNYCIQVIFTVLTILIICTHSINPVHYPALPPWTNTLSHYLLLLQLDQQCQCNTHLNPHPL
ncbi:uncharacterized protein EV420DRAFT_1488275 [Desarmillaria tabescens]|uniref:Uncharacterized protein n=1 Tax=Armillaria tabescens TaxID=1929756 RepID=A0AA39J2M6_ARMTA|nr:uncharacterized protein EV420DRAFT_1488275 [Desarmillaria tabescens]KAK0434995.1 hypothetical protein EV420DRAFT_1488275 [Desarmillaria tabescens]